MGCCNFRRRHFRCLYLVILLQVIIVCVQGQKPNTDGYINIDCGIASNTSYIHSLTGLRYVSDDQYIDTGINSNISDMYTLTDANYTDLKTLRSFPDSIKNCYSLNPLTKGLKYLVRAMFYYGNYDQTGKPPCFDLYLGVNLWSTVNISTINYYYYPDEIIFIAPANYIQVCLVNTGHGTPFINVLELRPMNNTFYQADSKQSLNLIYREDIGSDYKIYPLRFPEDEHDRLWVRWTKASWTAIFTNFSIDGLDFDVPSLVLQTAAIPLSVNGSIDIAWLAPDKSTFFLVMLHFSEIQVVPNNSLREFDIYANGQNIFNDSVRLNYLETSSVWYPSVTGYTDYNVSLKRTTRSTLPPILNAFELYSIVPVTWFNTDDKDVIAINSIKKSYNVSKGWNGDPCVPPSLNWAGVNCSIDSSNIPRITALNLSSSGLNGTIISDFGSLISLESLNLSHNNLSGNIPGSLDKLESLAYLDLSGNSGLSTTLPSGLRKKQKAGHLTVISDSTPSRTGHKNSSKTVIIGAAAAVVMFIIIATVAYFILYRKQKKMTHINPSTYHEGPQNSGTASSSNILDNPKDSALSEDGRKELQIDKRKFSFEELKHFTNNFSVQIGIGGFGKVFKGSLEDGNEVAVKVRSELSSQGIQQFLNEVEKLSRVHHKNLVSLIGYCKDRDQIALVYEYMQKGNLQDQIRVSGSSLPWKLRLRIAYESAQGLEYLHKMCNIPLIHRDVKTNNILLTTNLVAKVSDFGLVSYAATMQLTEKSDVYSFGVVLLEIITGQQPICPGPQMGPDLIQFVQQWLSKGNIEGILDPSIGGQYNINSIWKVADLALRCTDHPSKRPDMTAIVTELKETLNLEMSSMEKNSVSSEDISQSSGYSRKDFPSGGEIHNDNFEMARMEGMQLSDYGPLAR